jgi:hypothetical protein
LLAPARARLTPLPPSLLFAALTHTVPSLDANVSEVLQNSLANSPHQLVETCPPPTAPSAAPLKYPPHVRSLPKAGLKTRQARYGTALRVQCVTLFDAGIPIDIICEQWFVTKSAIYQWKRIAKA